MLRTLAHFVAEPRQCSYLPAEIAALEYRVMVDVEPQLFEQMLERGWRRFGVAYFRPRCSACNQCVSLRVPVKTFAPSRNQRRARNRSQNLRLIIDAPRIDDQRIALYEAWHNSQGKRRGWEAEPMTKERYAQEFAIPHPCAREFAYYFDRPEREPELVSVALVDETPNALSAVYAFHHPAYARWSLGTASIVRIIQEAKKRHKRWVYLGYRVLGCPSSEYKQNFYPHELLFGRPSFDEAAPWQAVDSLASRPSTPP